MRTEEFSYDLPGELVAQAPAADRTASRLLCLDGATGALADRRFTDVETLLEPGDLLVLNDVKVVRARLRAAKATGGAVEVLVERVLEPARCTAHLRTSRSPRAGSRLRIAGVAEAVVEGRQDDLFVLGLAGGATWASLMGEHGQVPLPPYIERSQAGTDDAMDAERYQTVYARRGAAVAAPTAGLHFDRALIHRLDRRGVELGYLTLHVGAGTFAPVRVDEVSGHCMHAERVEVGAPLCAQVETARARGGRVIAVGTTVVRALEAASRTGAPRPLDGDTRLFIYPGFEFACVDAMVTNLHLPRSTLLMLVCAFAGTANVLAAYRHAVAERYRFFSYGDAMFVTPRRRRAPA